MDPHVRQEALWDPRQGDAARPVRTRAPSLPGKGHGRCGPRRAPGRRSRPEVERDLRSTCRAATPTCSPRREPTAGHPSTHPGRVCRPPRRRPRRAVGADAIMARAGADAGVQPGPGGSLWGGVWGGGAPWPGGRWWPLGRGSGVRGLWPGGGGGALHCGPPQDWMALASSRPRNSQSSRTLTKRTVQPPTSTWWALPLWLTT